MQQIKYIQPSRRLLGRKGVYKIKFKKNKKVRFTYNSVAARCSSSSTFPQNTLQNRKDFGVQLQRLIEPSSKELSATFQRDQKNVVEWLSPGAMTTYFHVQFISLVGICRSEQRWQTKEAQFNGMVCQCNTRKGHGSAELETSRKCLSLAAELVSFFFCWLPVFAETCYFSVIESLRMRSMVSSSSWRRLSSSSLACWERRSATSRSSSTPVTVAPLATGGV